MSSNPAVTKRVRKTRFISVPIYLEQLGLGASGNYVGEDVHFADGGIIFYYQMNGKEQEVRVK